MPDPGSSELVLECAVPLDTEDGATAAAARGADLPDMTNGELVLLRVRVIALENLLIAVLAEGSDRQRQMAREMADVITPRSGSTQHALTIRAARHMTDLVVRAVHVRLAQP